MVFSRLAWHCKITSIALLAICSMAHAAELSPQYVFDNFGKRTKRLENIQLQARAAEMQRGAIEGIFDPSFSLRVGNEISRTESLTGLGNLEDRTLSTAANLAKKFSTGTQIELQYAQMRQQSVLNPFTNTLRTPNLVENRVGLIARQNLIYNAFGSADRNRIDAAIKNDEALKLSATEQSEELLLSTLSQFWATYRAKERLSISLEARKIYEGLLRDVREKRRLGLVDVADVARTSGNFEMQDQKVKQASSAYLDQLARLYDLMDEPVPADSEEIVFRIPPEVPMPPTETLVPKETLRQSKVVAAQLEAIHSERAAYGMEDMPVLDLIGEASWNGVDPSSSRSFSETLSGTRPRYYVGLEFGFRFGNQGTRSKLGDLVNREALNRNNQELSSRELNMLGTSIQRQLSGNYQIAQSAKAAREHYRQLLASQQRNYRLGRIELSQLIIDYNVLFDSELIALDAMSNYHILLHEWAALNDKLFKN